MNKTGRVQVRIDPRLKNAAEKVLAKVGLSPAEAIRLFYEQVELHQGLPFEVRVPNKETLAAMEEAEHPENLPTYSSFAELRKDVGV